MKFIAYEHDGREMLGLVDGDHIRTIGELEEAGGMLGMIRMPDPELRRLQDRAMTDASQADLSEVDVRPVPPLPHPGKMLFLARNYLEHGREVEPDAKLPSDVYAFVKPSSSLIGARDNIEITPAVTKLDHEIELGVVIGRPGRFIGENDALSHVFGYLSLNDISDRGYMSDVKARRIDWFSMKGQDGFCPMGPYLVTRDEVPDPQNLSFWLRVNGEPRQSGSTGEMIFTVRKAIAQLSNLATLWPGDIIAMGSPPGVALASGRFLADGDVIESSVGMGVMRNQVIVTTSPYGRLVTDET